MGPDLPAVTSHRKLWILFSLPYLLNGPKGSAALAGEGSGEQALPAISPDSRADSVLEAGSPSLRGLHLAATAMSGFAAPIPRLSRAMPDWLRSLIYSS